MSKPNLTVVQNPPMGTPLKYAHGHTPFYIPQLGNLKTSFSTVQVNPSDNRVKRMTLNNGVVEIVSTDKTGKDVTFFSAVSNFTVLVPE